MVAWRPWTETLTVATGAGDFRARLLRGARTATGPGPRTEARLTPPTTVRAFQASMCLQVRLVGLLRWNLQLGQVQYTLPSAPRRTSWKWPGLEWDSLRARTVGLLMALLRARSGPINRRSRGTRRGPTRPARAELESFSSQVREMYVTQRAHGPGPARAMRQS
jgi:hypothetical protein